MSLLTLVGAYESNRMRGRKSEVLTLLKAHGLALLAFVSITYMYEDYRYSRLVMIYFATIGAVALGGFRAVLRTLLRSLRRRGYNLRHVLVVGEGGPAKHLIERLAWYPEIGLRVAGIVTDDTSDDRAECFGVPVLDDFRRLRQIVESSHADEVVVSLPRSQQARLHDILRQLRGETIGVRIALDVQEHVTLGCDVEEFEGVPIVRLN